MRLTVVEQRHLAVRDLLDTGAKITDALWHGADRRTDQPTLSVSLVTIADLGDRLSECDPGEDSQHSSTILPDASSPSVTDASGTPAFSSP